MRVVNIRRYSAGMCEEAAILITAMPLHDVLRTEKDLQAQTLADAQRLFEVLRDLLPPETRAALTTLLLQHTLQKTAQHAEMELRFRRAASVVRVLQETPVSLDGVAAVKGALDKIEVALSGEAACSTTE